MIEARQDRRNRGGLGRIAGHAGAVTDPGVVGDAAQFEPGGAAGIERCHHARADVAGQQRQHIAAAYVMAQRCGFGGKGGIEAIGIELVAFQPCPGIAVGIDAVDAADDIVRQAALRLVAVEGIERRRGDDAAEIPQHRLDRHARLSPLLGRPSRYAAKRRCASHAAANAFGRGRMCSATVLAHNKHVY